jgi:hypothetical protein
MTHAILQSRLMRFLWLYEACVIALTMSGGFYIALGQGGSWALATPLLLVACAESLRIPIAGLSQRLQFFGRTLAVLALVSISLISFEGLTMIFEAALSNRTMSVLKQQRVVDFAQEALAVKVNDLTNAQAALVAATASVAAIDADLNTKESNPPAQPNIAGACGRNHGPCAIDRKARADFTRAQNEHLATLRELRAQRRAAQIGADRAATAVNAITTRPEEQAATSARHDLEDLKMTSPLHRLAASLLGVKVIALTEQQLESVVRWGVLGLAASFATLSSVVSLLAHAPERSPQEPKLSRSLRAYLARRRKAVVRVVEKPVPSGERTVFKYIPVNGGKDSLIGEDGLRGESLRAYRELFQ